MQLLTFAHRPEAQAFFEAYPFKSTSTEGLYQSEFGWLLITGEGIHEAIASVASILGAYPAITEVINLGVAGGLTAEVELHHIYEIRTSYAFDEAPVFKSFTLSGVLDCVTSGKRILSESGRVPLLAMGTVVDRELWGICFAAKQLNKSVRSFKYISDNAGELTACEVVKDLALKASLALLETYQSLSEKTAPSLFNLAGFYFTFSQEHLLKNYIQKLSIKWEISELEILQKMEIEHLRLEKISPKERTKKLLEKLKQGLDPWGSEFELKNQQRFQALQPVSISSISHFQNPELKLSFTFHSKEELEMRLARISSFDWKDFFDQYRVSDV